MKQSLTGPEVASFYHLHNVSLEHKLCRGLACFAGRARNAERWQAALAQDPPIECLGKCYMSPSSTEDTADPVIEAHCDTSIVIDGVADSSKKTLDQYGGYSGLEKVVAQDPTWFLSEIETAKLRGRGGAGFPAGIKWRAVAEQPSQSKYVVANADEGDHGSYIDRYIMERTPHRLLEALGIACYTTGATKAYIYLRKEYPVAREALMLAIEEARAGGWLGAEINGTSFQYDVEIVIGQGSYVCGEETSLLRSIEHKRPEVMARPPFPTQSGLFGKPTLVNNVETLASVPWIALNGGAAYAAMGTEKSKGTKAVSLNSLFVKPGLYEVEFGTPVREVFESIGGGFKEGEIKAAIIGGPLVGVLKPDEFDTPVCFDALSSVGASLGHGGIVAFDQSTRMIDLLVHVFAFGAHESCGKCTPCRLGSQKAFKILRDASVNGKSDKRAELDALIDTIRLASLCGHGTGLGEFAHSVFNKFGEELEEWFPS